MRENVNSPTASGLWLYAKCPGAFGLARRTASAKEPTEQMQFGSAVHQCIAEILLSQEPRATVEVLLSKYDNRVVSCAQAAVAACRELDCFQHADSRAWTFYSERRFRIASSDGVEIGSAQPDIIGHDHGMKNWVVIDFKVTNGRVSMLDQIGQRASNSLQLAAGFACACHEIAGSIPFIPNGMTLTKAYMKIDASQEEPCVRKDVARVDGHELARQCAAVYAIMLAAADPQAPLLPGNHCQWCPAKSVCVARLPFEWAGIPESMRPDPALAVQLNCELASYVYAQKSRIEALLERAKETLMALDDDALAGLGWRKSTSSGASVVTNAEAAGQALIDMGLTIQDLLQCAQLSIPKLAEKIAYALNQPYAGATPAVAQEWLEDRLKDLGLIEKRPDQVRLVRVKGSKPPSLDKLEET